MERYMKMVKHEKEFWMKINRARYAEFIYRPHGELSKIVLLKESEAIRKMADSMEHEREQLRQQREQYIEDINIKINDMKKINIYLTIMICMLLSIIVFLCFKLV